MKTETRKYFAVFPALALLIASVSMNSFASDVADHDVLAGQFESLAKEMQAKVAEQKDIFNHKPRSSYFGRNGQRVKSHVAYKIRKYEKAAADYLEQADYHHAIAVEQTKLKPVANQNQPHSKKPS